MSEFSDEEKLKAIEREIKHLKKIFSIWLSRGSMKEKEANRRIAVMEAIYEDYKNARRFRSIKDI